MVEHVCEICKVRFTVTSGRGRSPLCIECQGRIDTALRDAGYKSVRIKRAKWIDIIQERGEEGWDMLDGLERKRKPEDVMKVKQVATPTPALPTDPLGRYVAMVQDYSSAVACASAEKAAIDREAEAAKDKVDENIGRLKARLDEYTRINAVVLEPFIKALAQPVIDQKEIEKTRQQHAEEAARAEESRRANRAEMVNP